MKNFKKSLLAFMAISVLILSSCEKENNSGQIEEAPLTTNHELIKENLDVYMQNQSRGSLLNQYACSEQGNYTPATYVRHSVYLNEYYVPDFSATSSGTNRYATWMTNLQDWLTHDFNDTNASGNNQYSIFINYDVYGANGGTQLNATNGNRAYNEFVCQLMDQLNLTSASELNNYEFDLSITVDYFLCCTGSSCCDPVVYASGTAYTN